MHAKTVVVCRGLGLWSGGKGTRVLRGTATTCVSGTSSADSGLSHLYRRGHCQCGPADRLYDTENHQRAIHFQHCHYNSTQVRYHGRIYSAILTAVSLARLVTMYIVHMQFNTTHAAIVSYFCDSYVYYYCTLLTLCSQLYRIDTVLKSDRILVMEQGLVKEFASPHELLNDHDSFFYSLYHKHKNNNRSS